MLNSFLFIIPLTPTDKLSPSRKYLQDLCFASLLSQNYSEWTALIIGGENKTEIKDKRFVFIKYEGTKEEKLQIAIEYILKNNIKTNYIIRLDDDDIFNINALHKVNSLKIDFDVFCDKYHACIDLAYMCISYRNVDWIANTAVHKFEHALNPFGEKGLPLISQDHSLAWKKFYSDKKIIYAPKSNPLYYRVLSPYTITSGYDGRDQIINWKQHLNYLNGYGPWIPLPSSFYYYEQSKNISQTYFADKPLRNTSYWLLNRLKYLKNRILVQLHLQ